ncbi:hypothetical protein GOODEAATRI_022401, partial [Goodea atripinnis]
VLLYLLRSSKALVPEEEIANMLQWEQLDWQKYAEECKGMIVTNPGMVAMRNVGEVRVLGSSRRCFSFQSATRTCLDSWKASPCVSHCGDLYLVKIRCGVVM